MGITTCIIHKNGLTNIPSMGNSELENLFHIYQTADGSPTLSLGGEKMHSMEGAFSESLYIYATAMEQALNNGSPTNILSMGLGLGYNEFISLALAIKSGQNSIEIQSFESQSFLNQYLVQFLNGLETPLNNCYQQIVKLTADHFGLASSQLITTAKTHISKTQWVLNGGLPASNPTNKKYNLIYYDAFSSETNDQLWTEEHFENFLQSYCSDNFCVFTTYAATGRLKRSLKQAGFSIEKKEGFGKKRQSTLATRKNTD